MMKKLLAKSLIVGMTLASSSVAFAQGGWGASSSGGSASHSDMYADMPGVLAVEAGYVDVSVQSMQPGRGGNANPAAAAKIDGGGWGARAHYTYHAPEEIYFKLVGGYEEVTLKGSATYTGASATIDLSKNDYDKYFFGGRVGFAFALSDEFCLIPVVGFTWSEATLKHKATTSLFDTKTRGLKASGGVLLKYMFADNWDADLELLLKLPLNKRSKTDYDASTSNANLRLKQGKKLGYEVRLPVTYHWDSGSSAWDLGLAAGYRYQKGDWKTGGAIVDTTKVKAWDVSMMLGYRF
ncbi:outer membrane beta-barrel protein [Simkania negevensis]|uniref:Outer membrane beta-barrel protein n=1 Tax=Simkania negevensis TaxID=83561 RepID=A0ABS3ARK5_9BACT|nr:outer membrane beta-barrel protein [Simkania negevensis]